MIRGRIVTDSAGNPVGVRFEVNSFSTFAVIKGAVAQPNEGLPRVIQLKVGGLQAMVDGNPYTLDAEPFVKPKVNRTLVPVRFVSEALGARVDWVAAERRVVITGAGNEIILTVGSDRVLVNGLPGTLDCPAELVASRTFVPLRFVSETLGARVDYDPSTTLITITH